MYLFDFVVLWLDVDVYVDVLYGSGFNCVFEVLVVVLIECINVGGKLVFVLDVFLGLDVDCGICLGVVVCVSVMVCFIVVKCGLYIGVVFDYVGELELDML